MDVVKLLADLKAYKTQLDEAIETLERLAGGRGAAKTRRSFSEATKKKMASAQRKRWAEKRKAPQKQH